jgi:hypothetical protein
MGKRKLQEAIVLPLEAPVMMANFPSNGRDISPILSLVKESVYLSLVLWFTDLDMRPTLKLPMQYERKCRSFAH